MDYLADKKFTCFEKSEEQLKVQWIPACWNDFGRRELAYIQAR